MFKSIVNELVSSESQTIDIKVRSNEGAEIVLQIKPEEKFSTVKQEIWKNIGAKTQLKIGDAIIDIMTERPSEDSRLRKANLYDWSLAIDAQKEHWDSHDFNQKGQV